MNTSWMCLAYMIVRGIETRSGCLFRLQHSIIWQYVCTKNMYISWKSAAMSIFSEADERRTMFSEIAYLLMMSYYTSSGSVHTDIGSTFHFREPPRTLQISLPPIARPNSKPPSHENTATHVQSQIGYPKAFRLIRKPM
jgi:hypothetical protein